jgi:predicted dehydrogenase
VDLLVAEHGHRIMVGYNLRLHSPVEQFMQMYRSGVAGRPYAVRAWFGSWLPSWRAKQDWRTTYSARADLGGGILFDAIHELDLLCWMMPEGLSVVASMVERVSELDIDVEDTVKALLRSAGGIPVELSLDYLSRRYRRGLEVTGAEGNLVLDWSNHSIHLETCHGTTTTSADADVAESYRREAAAFVAWLRGEACPPVLGGEAAASVHLAAAIRRAAR